MRKTKICFAASSGGHFEQLMMLKPIMERSPHFVLTEKTKYATDIKEKHTYYLKQVNRKEKAFPIWLIWNAVLSFFIYLKERPNVVICTGVLAMIPMCLLCKLFGGKLIYIESFAKVTSPTETGKLMYKYADRFYVQWESMLSVYPDAMYVGGIY